MKEAQARTNKIIFHKQVKLLQPKLLNLQKKIRTWKSRLKICMKCLNTGKVKFAELKSSIMSKLNCIEIRLLKKLKNECNSVLKKTINKKKISTKLNQLVNIHKLIEIKNLTKWFFHYNFASFQSEKNKSR